MKAYFEQFAAYNKWANARLFGAALALPDADYRRPLGLFFGSVHGTLNHLLVTDRIWLGRLTGIDPEAGPLNRIVHDDLRDLARARLALDARLIATVAGFDDFDAEIAYSTTSGQPFTQRLRDILAHLFNHQTHHRSQAHSGLSILTGAEPAGLDLLLFQRGLPAPDLAALLTA